jgi:hypothetical protein
MGTNYYVRDYSEYCEHCGRGMKEIHLGKSSAAWCFALHIYPEKGIKNLEDILSFIKNKEIIDEYSRQVSVDDFIDIVTNRSWHNNPANYDFSRNEWYKTLDDFLRINNAELGPNNLLRHKIGNFCIKHGEGTYDYIVGDFS